jgi:hypothetical protein
LHLEGHRLIGRIVTALANRAKLSQSKTARSFSPASGLIRFARGDFVEIDGIIPMGNINDALCHDRDSLKR